MIANLRPSGEYLMEDFITPAGVRYSSSLALLHLDCQTVTGQRSEAALIMQVTNQQVIRRLIIQLSLRRYCNSLRQPGARRCVIKPTAAESRLLKHRGPAVVFKDYNSGCTH
jgi:dihydroxy-acid dehydratase